MATLNTDIMNNYFQRDERIEEDSALRALEKKVHYLMKLLSDQGMLLDEIGENMTIPDNMETGPDLAQDAEDVMRSKKHF